MKPASILALALLLSTACSNPRAEPPSPGTPTSASASRASESTAPPVQHDEGVAYFAGGCFWGVEHYLEELDGVLSVESGYMGGHVDSPSYEQVSSQTSGHLETVRVRFDPAKIGYEAVAKRFFEIHDPTQADGQGPDIGPEYRSAVFYTSAAQKQTSEALIQTLEGRGYDVVTELREAGPFWPAEDYHQNYYAKTGKTPYCHTRVRRFGD
ncbi:peptide-methionine (S)-S-oxide reductase MsrA [Nannocystaceae bacterium ST9]